MTDDTASEWPDPARPGVPLNAERDGWHWLKCGIDPAEPCQWIKLYQIWRGPTTPKAKAKSWRYVGPCLTPSAQSAREAAVVAAGAMEMREKAAQWHDSRCTKFQSWVDRDVADPKQAFPGHLQINREHATAHRNSAAHLRALPIDTTGLDRLLAEAHAAGVKEGLKQAMGACFGGGTPA